MITNHRGNDTAISGPNASATETALKSINGNINARPQSIVTIEQLLNEEPPKSTSDWLKLSDGEQVMIRFMADWLLAGEENWDENGEVTRWEIAQTPNRARYKNLRKFWAQVVYNYTSGIFQIEHFHQAHKYEQLLNLAKKYGSFNACDILIHRIGSDNKTRYTLIPQKPTPVAADIQAQYEALAIDMNQVFVNGNPLKATGDLPWN